MSACAGAPRTTGRARLGSEHHENDWEYLEYSSSVERPSGVYVGSEAAADNMGIGWAIAECVSCERCTENIRDERLREAGTCCEHDGSMMKSILEAAHYQPLAFF